MENGQEETKVKEETANDVVPDDTNSKPTVDDTKNDTENSAKNDAENSTKNDAENNMKNDTENDTKTDKEDVKEEKVEEPTAELLKKIREQIEYYFGNVNMQKDKFLIEQTKLDEGWVPMTVMLNFKMLASLSKDSNVILKALEASDLMEISEDKKKIRRSLKHPLPEYNEEYRKAQEAKTVYVKGFPLTDTNIDKLKGFFELYKPFDTIIMRKYLDNKEKIYKFKGSVFVQFKTLDDAKAFMAIESVKHEETELIRKWAADYAVEKAQEKEERRKKKPDNKKKSAARLKETEQAIKQEIEQTPAVNIELPKGAVIFFSGVSKTCTRENIKECFNEFDADVAYVDFQRGNTEGWIRLQGENTAKRVWGKMKEGKIVICNTDVSCKILEGEEEDKYLTKVMEEMVAKYGKARRGNKKGRSARGKKRAGSPSHDGLPAKKSVVE